MRQEPVMLLKMADRVWMKDILILNIGPVHRKNRKRNCEYEYDDGDHDLTFKYWDDVFSKYTHQDLIF